MIFYNCFTRLPSGNSIYQLPSWYFTYGKNAQQMQHFLSFWASYFMKHGATVREASFQVIWCLVWAGSSLPHSFLSCKQSNTERKDERAKNKVSMSDFMFNFNPVASNSFVSLHTRHVNFLNFEMLPSLSGLFPLFKNCFPLNLC